MATATTKVVTKTVKKDETFRGVKLDLTLREASVLLTLLGRVRGSETATTRKQTEEIRRALAPLNGVVSDDCCHFDDGYIYAS